MAIRADGVGHIVEIQLADTCRKIPRLPKALRETELFGNGLPKNLGIGENAGAVWIQTSEHGVPTRTTEWKGAVRAFKLHPTCCQLIDVRCLGTRIAIATKIVIQVIGDEKENVWLRRNGRRKHTEQTA